MKWVEQQDGFYGIIELVLGEFVAYKITKKADGYKLFEFRDTKRTWEFLELKAAFSFVDELEKNPVFTEKERISNTIKDNLSKFEILKQKIEIMDTVVVSLRDKTESNERKVNTSLDLIQKDIEQIKKDIPKNEIASARSAKV